MTDCRIYVASLSDYNAGSLLGRWIDANQDADDIHAEVREMLRESKHPNVMVECPDCDGAGCDDCGGKGEVPSAEEWAIHDYELGGIKISEHESFETVSALAEAVEEHGEAFVAWWNNQASGVTEVDLDAFQEAYQGEWDSLADYVENYWSDCGSFDASAASNGQWWHPANYIDWDRMAHDLELGGDVWTHDAGGKVYVFKNH
jgi:antirestriction protein